MEIMNEIGVKKVTAELFEMLVCQCCSNCAHFERTNKWNKNSHLVVLMAIKAISCIVTNPRSLLSSGASACVHLNQFEEAITWCDKGLALSFDNN